MREMSPLAGNAIAPATFPLLLLSRVANWKNASEKRFSQNSKMTASNPAPVNNCIKAVKTFYHVNGVEVELSEPLSRKSHLQRQSSKTRRTRKNARQSRNTRNIHSIAALATGGFQRRNLRQTKVPTRQRRPRNQQNSNTHTCRSSNHQRQIPRLRHFPKR